MSHCLQCDEDISDDRKFQRHHKRHKTVGHKDFFQTKLSNEVPTVSAGQRSSIYSFSDDASLNHLSNTSTPIAQMVEFARDESTRYYEAHVTGQGARYLVAKATHGIEDFASEIPDEEVTMHFRLVELCYTLSRQQRDQLATILSQVVIHTEKKEFHRSRKMAKLFDESTAAQFKGPVTNVPTSMQEIRTLYLEGSNAVIPNLPHPPIIWVDDHAYVSIRDVVGDLLAHGSRLEGDGIKSDKTATPSPNERVMSQVSSITESERYKSVALASTLIHPFNKDTDDHMIIICINIWSDDFEPNHTKNNRGTVWLMTATVGCPYDAKNSLDYTYPIAVGGKHADHSKVQDRLAKELKSLASSEDSKSNVFYHGGLQRNVSVYVEMFVTLQDQPERRKSNDLSAGNSTFHGRWGYALDSSQVAQYLPACETCFNFMLTNGDGKGGEWKPTNQCQECVNWSYDIQSPLLDTNPPADYPDFGLTENKKLRPKKLSYNLLKKAVTSARGFVEDGMWTEKQAASYLAAHCISKDLSVSLLDPAVMRCCRRLAEGEEKLDLDNLEKANPTMFQDTSMPVLWDRQLGHGRGIELMQHIDVPMHLLFLGIQKSCIMTLISWIKLKSKYTPFVNSITGVLDSIPLMDWCSAAPWTGDKLGGWVSENYLAVARLSNWLFGNLHSIVATTTLDDKFEQPNIHHSKWVKKTYQCWLKVHGITLEDFVSNELSEKAEYASLLIDVKKYIRDKTTINKLGVDILRQLVGAYIDSQRVPAPVRNRICGVDEMLQMNNALHLMISKAMAPTTNEESIKDLDRKIRIFLTLFAKVDSSMSTSKPQWIGKYNYLCLLNIPDAIREFGPLRNLWEGSSQGEGFIRSVKPLLCSGLKKNWQFKTMEKILKYKALKKVFSSHDFMTSKLEKKVREGFAYTYANMHVVHDAMEKGKPIACVGLENGTTGILLDGSLYLTIERVAYHGLVNNCHYHTWTLLMDNPSHLLVHHGITMYMLLLPKLTTTGLPSSYPLDKAIYTVVNSSWEVIGKNGEFHLADYECL